MSKKRLSEDDAIQILLILLVAPFAVTVSLLMFDSWNDEFRDHGSCIDINHSPKYHGAFLVDDIVLVNSTTNETIAENLFGFEIGICNESRCDVYAIYWCYRSSINDTLQALRDIPEAVSYNQVWLHVTHRSIPIHGYQTLLPNRTNYIQMKWW